MAASAVPGATCAGPDRDGKRIRDSGGGIAQRTRPGWLRGGQ
jgi:hypothetical protein